MGFDYILDFMKKVVSDFLVEIVVALIIMIFSIAFKEKLISFFKVVQYSIKQFVYKICGIKSIIIHGRDMVIADIYKIHNEGKSNKCIFICGNGGAGKTTIAKYCNLNKFGHNVVIVNNKEYMPTATDIKSNRIYFFDYILEFQDKIATLYNALRPNMHITFVLLERELAIDNLSQIIEPYETIDLNNNILTKKNLEEIIYDNILYDYNTAKSYYCKSYNNCSTEKIKEFAKDIIERIDPRFHRPIFAVIVAQLYKKNNNFDLRNLNNISELFQQYWDATMGGNKYKKLITLTTAAEKNIINRQINNVKILTLLVSITDIDIYIDFETGKKIVDLQYHSMPLECEVIRKFVIEKTEYITEKNYEFFFSKSLHKKNACVQKCDYDLVAAWLFVSCIDNDNLRMELHKMFIVLLSQESYEKLIPSHIYSFYMRVADENNEYFEKIVEWFKKDTNEGTINYEKKIDNYLKGIVYSKKSESMDFFAHELKELYFAFSDKTAQEKKDFIHYLKTRLEEEEAKFHETICSQYILEILSMINDDK